jgi:hypothetical protein
MADDAVFLQVYDDLVREHGLSSPAHLAIAKSLATLMVNDGDPVATARQIASLTAMLPATRPVSGLVDTIQVELVPPKSNPDAVEANYTELLRRREQVQALERQVAQLTQRAAGVATATDLPSGPLLIAPPSDGNVVPMARQTQQDAAGLTEHEKRQRQAKQNHDAALKRAPIVNGDASQRYAALVGDADNPRGVSRFERFDYPKGTW